MTATLIFAPVTIQQAIEELLQLPQFVQDAARNDTKGARLRMFRKRYRDGVDVTDGAVRLLMDYGFEIDVKKPKGKKA